jgi:hypothetical protein
MVISFSTLLNADSVELRLELIGDLVFQGHDEHVMSHPLLCGKLHHEAQDQLMRIFPGPTPKGLFSELMKLLVCRVTQWHAPEIAWLDAGARTRAQPDMMSANFSFNSMSSDATFLLPDEIQIGFTSSYRFQGVLLFVVQLFAK